MLRNSGLEKETHMRIKYFRIFSVRKNFVANVLDCFKYISLKKKKQENF